MRRLMDRCRSYLQMWLCPDLLALVQQLRIRQQEQDLKLQKLEHDLLALTFTVAISRSSESAQATTTRGTGLDPHLGRQ